MKMKQLRLKQAQELEEIARKLRLQAEEEDEKMAKR